MKRFGAVWLLLAGVATAQAIIAIILLSWAIPLFSDPPLLANGVNGKRGQSAFHERASSFIVGYRCGKYSDPVSGSHMNGIDEKEVITKLRAARDKARGYADFFGWATDRDLEEWGVVSSLAESLEADNALFFSDLKSRGRRNDPPDCEARTPDGARVAIEVTELVDGKAIKACKAGHVFDWAEWPKEKFHSVLQERISKKGERFGELKDAPYEGGYVVVIHSDEPELSRSAVAEFLSDFQLAKPSHVDRVFLVLSYDPAVERCPYFELQLNG